MTKKTSHYIRVFHKHRKLALLLFIAHLVLQYIYSLFSSLFLPTDVSKGEIRNQGVYEVYMSRLYTSEVLVDINW